MLESTLSEGGPIGSRCALAQKMLRDLGKDGMKEYQELNELDKETVRRNWADQKVAELKTKCSTLQARWASN